jgi:hypothetical protein
MRHVSSVVVAMKPVTLALNTAGENFHQLSPRAAETLMATRGEFFGIRLACDHGSMVSSSPSSSSLAAKRRNSASSSTTNTARRFCWACPTFAPFP